MPFAENLARLDEIAKRLESEPMSMDEALAVFEEGVALVKKSEKLLQRAERKVTILTEEGEALFEPAQPSGVEEEGEDEGENDGEFDV